MRAVTVVAFAVWAAGASFAGSLPQAHSQPLGTAAPQKQKLVPRGDEEPSYDCRQAKTAAARLICADAELTHLDGRLGIAYQKRKTQISIAEQSNFVAEQLSWIRQRNSVCKLIGKDSAPITALANAKPCMLTEIQNRIAILTQTSVVAQSTPPAVSGDSKFGAVPFQYEKIAGPVSTTGSYPDTQVLLNGQIILEDHSSDSIDIVVALPNWQDPSIVVLNLSPGGNSCAGSYVVLDVRSGHLTEPFGNCGEPAMREGSNSLIFAFADQSADLGWVYQDGQLNKIPTLRAEEHVQIGVAAYQSKNYSKALEHLWLARESRFADASYYLGLMANYGHGVRQNYTLAMSLYKQAADIGSPEALFRIGALFANGQGMEKNAAEAMRWYVRAAELGNGLAQYSAGLGYLNGDGVPKDAKRALFWMLLAQDRLVDATLVDALRNNIGVAERQLDDEAKKSTLADVASWKPTSLKPEVNPTDLRAWVGKYPTDRLQGLTFLERPEVQLLVSAALSSDAVSQMRSMLVVEPIAEYNNWLIAHGCQPHMCVDGQWLVAINLTNLETRACLALVDSPTVRFGVSDKKFIDLPRADDEACPSPEEALAKFDFLFARPVAVVTPVLPVTPQAPKVELTGSGFVVNSKGQILTNYHVIQGCSEIIVRTGSHSQRADLVAFDETNDLAVVHADLGGVTPLTFRDGTSIRPAETVLSVGFPYTGILSTAPNVTIGAVSALAGLGDDTRFLQISTPVQPGNSGGPLLDISGNVVGVIDATLNAVAVLKVTGSLPQNVNFAIKSDVARMFMDTRGINYGKSSSSSKYELADIGDKGSRASALLECLK